MKIWGTGAEPNEAWLMKSGWWGLVEEAWLMRIWGYGAKPDEAWLINISGYGAEPNKAWLKRPGDEAGLMRPSWWGLDEGGLVRPDWWKYEGLEPSLMRPGWWSLAEESHPGLINQALSGLDSYIFSTTRPYQVWLNTFIFNL